MVSTASSCIPLRDLSLSRRANRIRPQDPAYYREVQGICEYAYEIRIQQRKCQEIQSVSLRLYFQLITSTYNKVQCEYVPESHLISAVRSGNWHEAIDGPAMDQARDVLGRVSTFFSSSTSVFALTSKLIGVSSREIALMATDGPGTIMPATYNDPQHGLMQVRTKSGIQICLRLLFCELLCLAGSPSAHFQCSIPGEGYLGPRRSMTPRMLLCAIGSKITYAIQPLENSPKKWSLGSYTVGEKGVKRGSTIALSSNPSFSTISDQTTGRCGSRSRTNHWVIRRATQSFGYSVSYVDQVP